MRKNDARKIGIAAGIALLVLLAVGVYEAGRDAPPVPGPQPMNLQQGSAFGQHLSSRSWTFNYGHVTVSPDGTMAQIEGVRGGVLFKDGKPYMKMWASHLTANTLSQDYDAHGTVHLETLSRAKPMSFDTDAASYVNATKTLTLPRPSVIRTGSALLKVKLVTVNFANGKIHLGPISGGLQL